MNTVRRSGSVTRRSSRRIAVTLAAVLAMTVITEVPAAAAERSDRKPATSTDVPKVRVAPVKHSARPVWTAGDREIRSTPKVVWPAAGRATVDLTAPTGADRAVAGATPRWRAGQLPVWVSGPPLADGQDIESGTGGGSAPVGRATVEVADRASAAKAGVSGLVLKVNRADGSGRAGAVTVQVDYAGFARAYGGDWSSRLRMVTLPTGQPLQSRNDTRASVVSAVVPLAADGSATTLALTASASGDNGNFSATSLSAASVWQVSQQTGAFSWSYPLRMPPAVGGPQPSLGLSYSSGSLDGRTSGNNTQGSWIGDGWDMWPGYIERQYRPCADDKDALRGGEPNNKTVNSGDQCWYKPEGNATISLNGKATELVKSAGNTWKGVADDGSRIELLKDTNLGNGDADGEYWKVTTTAGMQYFFGRNKGPGGASAAVATNSVWTTQVYGNHPDEPGYQAGNYAGSRTTQGWRWNLDYVVDPHGNTMTYFYAKEVGAYGREGDPSKRTTYDRGGHLTEIQYGNRADAASTTQAAARIVFEVADRCATNCWSGTDPVAASWPDTPWDQYCKQAPCTDILSPTYWTSKRLSLVKAQVYAGSGTTYNDVEWWSLRHTYLDAGGNEGRPMWLAGITRTGKVTTAGGGEVSDPEIVINPGADALPGRVVAEGDTRSSLFRYRVNTITTETGAQIAVTYSSPECVRTALPTVHANNKPCFPQYYGPPGEQPTLDWFHKYRVTRVDTYDNTGGSSREQTNYDYLDDPAWHYDDSELVDEKKRTWGQYRGYGKVRVRKGLETGVQSATEYLYLRGMDGDKQPNNTVRDVWVTDSQNFGLEDHEAYAGMLREQTTLLGAGGDWVSGTINTPVRQGPTATSGPLKAWMTNVGTVRSRSRLSGGGTRWTKTVTSFNSDNLPTQVDDLGDESTATDDTCTRTWYARNATNWMLDRAKKTESVGVNCSTTPSLPGDMLTSTRITYDLATNDWDTYLPVKGDVAKVEEIDSWSGTTPNWVTTSRSTYDANGRTLDAYDALNRKTSTAYTPASAGPVTSTTVTNPMGHTVTSTMAPAWAAPVTVVDANNQRTDVTYDGLGRLLKVWLPGRAKATYPSAPDTEFTYLVRTNAPTAVTTKTLTASVTAQYRTQVTLYDGLLRQRQTQTQAPGGGRVLSDTVHDSRGLVQWVSNPYYDTTNTAPNTTLVAGVGTPAIPAFTENVHDGAERLTNSIFKVGVNQTINEKWRTVTSYDGERTSVTPPNGGTAVTKIFDADGRVTALRQYKNRADVGSDDTTKFDVTTYAYTDRGELASVTDPAGNTWRYGYDQRGRKTRDEDPDKGISTSTYDLAGQLTTTTDARNTVLAFTYDSLGRKTSVREDSITGPKRAEWVFDSLQNGVGRITKSIRYEPAGSTNTYVNEIKSYDTAGRPLTSAVSVPTGETGLCAAGTLTPCTYTYTNGYRPNGALDYTTLPAAGGLTSETLYPNYNDVGQDDGLYSANQEYAFATYNKLGQISQRILGQGDKRVWVKNTINHNTSRLDAMTVELETKAEVAHYGYTYDDSGNIVKITDSPIGGTSDTQCYQYDYLRRLTEAWTPTSGDCATTRSVAGLGGPAAYWHSYTYDTTGNRTTETLHGTTDTLRTYSYPAAGGAPGSKPHAVSQVVTTGATSKTESYTYDEAGNMKTRPGAAGTQTMVWDKESRLASSTDSAGTTSYVYDADGNRLIRRDPAGSTLYLPGGTEVRKPTSTAVNGTRYYAHAGTMVAVRSSTGSLNWITADHHGTAEATIRSTDLAVARRRTTPFGAERGAVSGTWPTAMDKGFVGGTRDNTGLTHLGAREYDPGLGRFISVDPIQDLTDPQQWNAYSYGNNNPATLSDPSGLKACSDDACAPGADFEDLYGNYHATAGNNDGCGGSCGDDDWTEARKRKPSSGGKSNGGGHSPEQAEKVKRAKEIKKKTVTEIIVRAGGQLLLDLFGITDILNCVKGDVMSCVWALAGMLPISKVGTWLRNSERIGKLIMKTADSVRRFQKDVKWADEVLASCGRHSFAAGTRVLMADGSSKPIELVEVGDRVAATDPVTGETVPKTVTALHLHADLELTDLTVTVDPDPTVAGDETRTVVHTTPHHPFWNATTSTWTPATDLRPGDRLTSPTGHSVTTTAVTDTTATQWMYNLTVTDLHTYNVIAGDTPVLVHNCGDGLLQGFGFRDARGSLVHAFRARPVRRYFNP